MLTSEVIVTLLGGGVMGAIIPSLFRYLNNRKGLTISLDQQLREEMQTQLDAMKLEIKELRDEVNVWKAKYFELYEEHIELKGKFK